MSVEREDEGSVRDQTVCTERLDVLASKVA